MEGGNPIKDKDGGIPYLSTATPDWTGWFGLNIEATRIPTDVELFAEYDMKDRDEELEPTTASGKFEDLDWAAGHDWYRPSTHWRGWIPIKDFEGELSCPEFLDFERKAPTILGMRGLWYIPSRYATDLANHFEFLDALVDKCAFINLEEGLSLVKPPPFSGHSLNSAIFNSDGELQKTVAAVRRAIADRMGWLAWFRASIPLSALQNGLPLSTVSDLLEETTIPFRRRGFIMRLADCWNEINILLWLSHRLPLLYCWRFNEHLLPQLARMNLKLIAGDTSDGRVSIHDVDDDEEAQEAARLSWNFDDFFQPLDSVADHETLSFETDALFYIIDFQGWGRRPLPATLDISEYCRRFFFIAESSEVNDGGPSVIFWRWRKKQDRRRDDFDQSDVRFDENFVREIYKDSYAPRKGRRFDEESGLPAPSEPQDENMPFTPFADHRRHPSYDSGSQYTSSESEDSVPGLEDASESQDESPSLLERLGMRIPEVTNQAPYSTVANVTSWRLAGRAAERLEQRTSLAGRIGNIRHRSSRSRSPRRPLAANVFPGDRPLTLFRRSLQEVSHYISPPDHLETLPDSIYWHPVILSRGALILKEVRSEVRLRYYANSRGHDTWHIGQLLKLAIEKRWAFRIGIPSRDIQVFAPRRLSQADRRSGDSLYGPDFVEAPLNTHSPTIFAASYIARVGELLRRPHAGAFIGIGGATSWLAQHWGGDGVVERFMRGPSVQTTIFRKGASDIKEREPKDLLWDEVRGAEMDLLFGFVPDPVPNSNANDRWLYPPPHLLDEMCDNWTGEWNWVMERIFTYLSEELLKTPCPISPRSRGAWKKWLRTYNGGIYSPVNVLTDQHVSDIMKGIALAKLPPTWNQRPLSSCHLPESGDD